MAVAIDLANQALVLLGEEPITSFEDGTTASVAAKTFYEPTVLEVMSRRRWRFLTTTAQLSRLGDAPRGRFAAAYQMPTDCLAVQSVTIEGDPIEFDPFSDQIQCDADATEVVDLEYQRRVFEGAWPAWFAAIVPYELALSLAIPVTGSPTAAELHDGRLKRAWSAAVQADGQGRTARAIARSRFLAFR